MNPSVFHGSQVYEDPLELFVELYNIEGIVGMNIVE